MKLTQNEKSILCRLVPGKFVAPTGYLLEPCACPLPKAVYRLREKGLVIFQRDTWTPVEWRKRFEDPNRQPPGFATLQINAALKPTKEGAKVIRGLKKTSQNDKLTHGATR